MDERDDDDCFVSIDIDGSKLMLATGSVCIGIKSDEMDDYIYMNRAETELLIYALIAAVGRMCAAQ